MNIKEVLEKQISLSSLNKEEADILKKEAESFIRALKKKIKSEIFIGGSLAKGTIVRKQVQDVDIFIRFKSEDQSKKLGKLKIKGYIKKVVHGSRDYLQFEKSRDFSSHKNPRFLMFKKGKIVFEVVPVLKISSPGKAGNVTDLSYFHVNYIKKQIKKNKNLADEIKLGKAFCFANECYGAESFIKGFSGYGLELLISYYGSFKKWLEAMVKVNEKLVIDPKKHYKNKQEVLNELNESKLSSPIVFVDPTFKERNVLAALSKETFIEFQKQAKVFLNKPSLDFFKARDIDEKDFNLILNAKTNRQEGDIAGTKLLKFFNYLKREINEKFELKKSAFRYDNKKKGKYYFNIKEKESFIQGPPIKLKIAVANFKKEHKKTFVKKGKVCAKLGKIKIKDFLKKLDKKIMKEMGIVSLKVW